MLYEISELVEPVHAQSFFSVSATGEIHEKLSYEYIDPEGYYRNLIQDDNSLAEEIRKLSTNMQYFLDQERVELNNEHVRSFVNFADIFLKGASEVVEVMFLIDFAGRLKIGKNRIETWLEAEIAPYDFEIVWRYPVGSKVLEINSLLEYEIYDDLVVLWAYEGENVGGYEIMEFEIPSTGYDTRVTNDSTVV